MQNYSDSLMCSNRRNRLSTYRIIGVCFKTFKDNDMGYGITILFMELEGQKSFLTL